MQSSSRRLGAAGDVADVGLGVVREIAEERLVEHHAERTAPTAQYFLEPGELRFLLGGAGAEELSVEAHELPRSAFEAPSVGAEQALIVGQPSQIERMRVGDARLDRVVADVVIARHEAHLLSEPGKDGARRRELARIVGPVGRDVAQMDHEGRSGRLDPDLGGPPVVRERGRAWRQMGVGYEHQLDGEDPPRMRGYCTSVTES